MDGVVIVGTGMTAFGKYPESTVRSLAVDAVDLALRDAQLLPEDVDQVMFSNAIGGLVTGQEMIRGQVALRYSGLAGKPIINIENACASGSSAFYLACAAVAGGAADVVVAVGAEKMSIPDKARVLAAIGTASDLFEREEGVDGPSFMEIYAETAKQYMAATGATAQHFAQVVVDSRFHASLNPKAQFRVPTSIDEVLAAREVASPLTVPMCSPVGDGGAALVVASERWARSKGLESIRVLSTVLLSGHDRSDGPSSTELAARLAYDKAGIGPDDVDIVELHDAAAPAFLTLLEELALCADGEAANLIDERATVLGGRLPVNVSGGLLSKGHPIGATGCAQLVELCDQLRGRAGDRQADGLQIALAENAGGSIGEGPAAAVVTVLGR